MTTVMSDFISTWANPHLGEIIMMKKSIFAVAVASVLTLGAAQAETVLYGSIRYDYENKKASSFSHGNATSAFTDANGAVITGAGAGKYNSGSTWTRSSNDRVSNLEDAGSRIGIKGNEDLGNGNAVIYQLEWAFDGMEQGNTGDGFKNRLAVLGLTGNWGTMTAGRQDNPFKVTIVDDSVVDAFNGSNVINSASQRAMTTALSGVRASSYTHSTGYDNVHDLTNPANDIPGSVGAAATFYKNGLGDEPRAQFSRVGKSIAYTTPEFAGFQANVALVMDEASAQEKHVDLWTVNARYAYDLGANGTILTKVGYIHSKLDSSVNFGTEKKPVYAQGAKAKSWGLFLGYSQDAFAVTANYAKGDHTYNGKTHKDKSTGWDLGASYSFGANYFSTVRATYGESSLKTADRKDKVKSWAVGFEQKLSTRTRAWVEYGSQKEQFQSAGLKDKFDVISVGMRHDF